MIKKIMFYIAIFILSSCNTTPKLDRIDNAQFSIKDFFENEIVELNNGNYKVQRTLNVNGAINKKENAKIDWNNELKPFIETDINKTSWMDKIKSDTIGDKILIYPISDEIPIKKIEVLYLNKLVKSIYIRKEISNIFYKNTFDYYYSTKDSISIVGIQKPIFFSADTFIFSEKISN
jgi:hypothetical protein